MNDVIVEETTALALPKEEVVKKLNQEVQDEYTTSSEEVYKEAKRSLVEQENLLLKQMDTIRRDTEIVKFVGKALEKAFINGDLISEEDAKRVSKQAKAAYRKSSPFINYNASEG